MALDDALRELNKMTWFGATHRSAFETILRAYAQPADHIVQPHEMVKKLKPTLRLRYDDTPDGQVAITILEQEGIERGCGHVYTAKNGVEMRSDTMPLYGQYAPILYLRGVGKKDDLTPLLVSPAEARRIQEAISEWRERG